MKENIKKIAEKCKKIKGFEIICALVIAAVAVCIYFSVNAVTSKVTTDKSEQSAQSGLIGDVQDILSKIDGVGKCQVLITYKGAEDDKQVSMQNNTDNIQGVVVVAEGANDVLARIKITNALCTLLKIEADNIQIFEMK